MRLALTVNRLPNDLDCWSIFPGYLIASGAGPDGVILIKQTAHGNLLDSLGKTEPDKTTAGPKQKIRQAISFSSGCGRLWFSSAALIEQCEEKRQNENPNGARD
jgi:hypothetical protein